MVAEQKDSGRRLAVLDIDGTLTDTIPLHHAAFLAAMESFAFPNLDRDWAGYTHHTDTAIFEEAWQRIHGINATLDQRAAFHARLEDEFARTSAGVTIREIAGAATFVQALRDRGWAVVFATGGLRKLSRTKLAGIGIPFVEEILVTASEHVTREELVTHAIIAANKHSGFEAAEIISIGDGIWDLKTAKALNLPFLGVGIGAKADELRDRGANVVPDFQDIPAVMAALDRSFSFEE